MQFSGQSMFGPDRQLNGSIVREGHSCASSVTAPIVWIILWCAHALEIAIREIIDLLIYELEKVCLMRALYY